jgi:hypothetical protein
MRPSLRALLLCNRLADRISTAPNRSGNMGRSLEAPMESIVNGNADAWRRRIDDQRASGQSVRAWCKSNGSQVSDFVLKYGASGTPVELFLAGLSAICPKRRLLSPDYLRFRYAWYLLDDFRI